MVFLHPVFYFKVALTTVKQFSLNSIHFLPKPTELSKSLQGEQYLLQSKYFRENLIADSPEFTYASVVKMFLFSIINFSVIYDH